MADAWVVFAWLVVTTTLIKASGPVMLGGRELPERVTVVIALLAPALLASLVVTETFRGEGSELIVDERALGVASAGGVLALRGSVLAAGAAAMGVTALARALL
ncbi:MAG: AzlD domain-containing protein [Actinomycetota bacterium]|nr:AzlD domain-containing protein [Actinomycetota bacterium]